MFAAVMIIKQSSKSGVLTIGVVESLLDIDPRGRCRCIVVLVFKLRCLDVSARAIRFVYFEGIEKGFDPFSVIRTKRVEYEMDVNLLLLLADDIVRA